MCIGSALDLTRFYPSSAPYRSLDLWFRSFQAEPEWAQGCDWAFPPSSGPFRYCILASTCWVSLILSMVSATNWGSLQFYLCSSSSSSLPSHWWIFTQAKTGEWCRPEASWNLQLSQFPQCLSPVSGSPPLPSPLYLFLVITPLDGILLSLLKIVVHPQHDVGNQWWWQGML